MREYRELPPRVVGREMQLVDVTCDACGEPAWHSAHRRAVAELGRVQDDERGNVEYWWLDLCVGCKDAVMTTLRHRAKKAGRDLPNERGELFPKAKP